jgi:hypothetical protein
VVGLPACEVEGVLDDDLDPGDLVVVGAGHDRLGERTQ